MPSLSAPKPAEQTHVAASDAGKASAEKSADRDPKSATVPPPTASIDPVERTASKAERIARIDASRAKSARGITREKQAMPEADASVPESLPPAAQTFAQQSRPVVPAQRVSTSAERIEAGAMREEPSGYKTQFRLYAAPPSRFPRVAAAFGREVLIEVPPGDREGLEEKIVEAALRYGGNAVNDPERTPADMHSMIAPRDSVRIMLPAESSKNFLFDLRKLGTVPPDGIPAWADTPSGPSPGTVVYTVRIRVR
jgi:hypothetical protein